MSVTGGTIVVGFVPTAEGNSAIARAGEEAKLRGAALVVVRSYKSPAEMEEALPLDLQLAWQAAQESLATTGVEYTVKDMARGSDPSDDVLTAAEEVDATLIVIGLRKRSPVGKLIMGSNAQQILLGASCPVLSVKAE